MAGPIPRPLADRFWDKVPDQPGLDCWEWAGARDPNGYGRIQSKESGKHRAVPAHRVAYSLCRGNPAGMFVCHACDNPSCVNPSHLFLGTQIDNMQDCAKKGRHARYHSTKTHCKHGHPFSPENTRLRNGERICIACTRAAYTKHNSLRQLRRTLS